MSRLVKLFKKFPTEESCIEFLENIRWKDGVIYPYCGSVKTCNHITKVSDTRNAKRHQCQDCHKSFSVTVGTTFHHTHLDLRKQFWIISIMLSKERYFGLSSCS